MIERRLLRPVSAIPPSSVTPFPLQARIAVTSNGSDLGARVIQLLNQHGYNNTILVDELPADCDVAIVLDGLRIFSDQQQAILINTQVFQQAQRIAARFSEHGGWLFTAQDTGGVFGLSAMHTWQPWSAGITGLVKTAALEWPKAHCRALDVQIADQTPQCLAERIVREILIDSQDVERGLIADGRRITLQAMAETLAEHISSPGSRYPWFHQSELIKADTLPLILITGGARGVTSACIIALAQRAPLRLVLLGRTALTEEPAFCQSAADESALKHVLFSHYQAQNQTVTPKQINQQVAAILANREIQGTLIALQTTGSQAHYLAVDVSDEQNLTNALVDVRQQWGDIHGVIHGAGVLADKRIVEKTAEQFANVFNTKVVGLKNILAATAQDPLQLIVLFSSVAARFGNPGQCDYAMANEVLNKVAQQQQRLRKHCVVKSINWGPWEGGMVTPQLKQLFKQRGVALVSLQEGTQRFVAECEFSGNENGAPMSKAVEVVIGGTLNPSAQPAVIPADNTTSRPTTEIATPAVAPTTQQFTVSIDVNSHPYLTSHVIQGIPVIPACLVMEWFMRAAQAHYPDIMRVTCQHFRVLRGIRLTEFYQRPQQFVVTSRVQPDNPQQLQVSLHAPDKPLPAYYSAEITLTTDTSVVPIAFDTTVANAWPYTLQEIYDPPNNPLALFHGQHFQAISNLQKVLDYGGVAEIKGVHAMQWPDDWQLDLVAIDSAFQLLWLWGARMLGKPSLPMAVGSLRVFAPPTRNERLTCAFNSQVCGHDKTVSTVDLADSTGKLYARLQDVEMVCYDVKVDNRVEVMNV